MTRQRSFKHLVRTRMQKTGERYTAARTALLSPPPEEPTPAGGGVLATPDASIRERTGRGWEEWFDLLDAWGAPERTHREIAIWVAEQQGIVPLAWNAQAVAHSYELARGLRAVGEHHDGYRASITRTVAVPVERLFDAFVDPAQRERWFDGDLHERTATEPRSARFDWGEGDSRVHVTFAPKGDGRSTATVSHERLADAAEAEGMKAFWRDRMTTMKQELER
jgi:uncharacterized protein YndB with AHSA1/START domain